MRGARFLTLIATLGVIAGPGRPAEASSLRRAYFRVETRDAGRQLAPYGARELPGGIVSVAVPASTLESLAAAPGLTFVGFEGLYHPAPIATEEVQAASTRAQAAADPARPCLLPSWIPPVGWGIKAMYDDPTLVRPSGGARVRVGVLDTGVSPHLDLVRRLVKCMDLTPSDLLPPCADSMNHGTLVASVIAADGGADGLGMWGMAPEAELYSYRVCEPNRECWGAYVAAGIYAAIEDSMNIINMSLDGPGHDAAILAAIDAALAHNILLVGAAGNSPPFSYIGWPASYPEVLSVGAITENREPWLYSAPGFNDGDYVRESREIDVAAPGAAVLAALKSGCWVLGSGTSLASPMVAGLAAKLWDGSAASTRARIQRAARFRDMHVAGDDTLTGFGLPTIRDFSGAFVVNASVEMGGTISPSGAVTVTPGGTRTFTIAPEDSCFAIEDVIVDGVSRGRLTTYTFTNMTADHVIRATFSSRRSFTIAATAGPGGAISPPGVSVVPCGSTWRYTFSGLLGCGQIQDVKVDGLSQGPISSYTFADVRSNHTISATFTAVGTASYVITAAAGSGGKITPSGVANVTCGASKTYTIAPLSDCYGITDVKVDGVSKGPITSYTFTEVASDHVILAQFTPGLAQYTITASAGAGGTITPSGPRVVGCGTNQTYTINPNACFRVQDVKVDGVSKGAITTYTFAGVLANHTIAATFVGGPFTITASASAGGTITPDGTTTVACGANQTYTIASAGGCPAYDVKVDGLSQGPITTYTFPNVQTNHTITATFAPGPFTITASAGPGGTISPSGETSVPCMGSRSFTITPSDGCPAFDVKVDGASLGPITAYTFSNVTVSHTISATFTPGPFNINASASGGGTISPSGLTSVACRGTQNYVITPPGGCPLFDVKVDGVSKGAITSYTFNNVAANHTISATFTPGPFTITASAGTGGTISPSGVTTVACGGSQAYAITRSASCGTYDVKVDGQSMGQISSYTFGNVLTNHTISVAFSPGPFTISASGNAGGTISPSGATTVACGGSQTYTITPTGSCPGYDVRVDGASMGPITSYTFSNVTASHTISVTFNPGPFTITATAGAGGTISPSGVRSVACGDSQTYTITPAGTCGEHQVTVDGVTLGPIRSYTFTNVTANHTISVTFPGGSYTIGATANAGGTISPSGTTTVPCGGSQTYTITRTGGCPGYDVKVDGVSMGPLASYTFTNVQAHHSIAVIFTTGPFAINPSRGNGGSISPSYAAVVACGGSSTFLIFADRCYKILDVRVDGVSQGPVSNYTFTNVTGNHTILATFTAVGPIPIEVVAGPGGTISPGPGTVACGENRTYTIVPVDNCHPVQDVKVDGLSKGPITSYLFTDVRSSHTIEATFATLGPYAIDASAGAGGTIDPSGTASVECGATQIYTVAPADNCHRIQDVKVDGFSRGAITGFTFLSVRGRHSIEAEFSELGPYAIDASAGPGGSISPVGATEAVCGGGLSYTIAPSDSCHVILDVKVDGVSQGPIARYDFNGVAARHAIEAVFSALGPYSITASAGPGSTISPGGAESVACGGSLSYAIAPSDPCRVIHDVLVDGVSVGAVSRYTFPEVRGNHTIAAVAAPAITLSETHGSPSWSSDGMIDLTVAGGTPPFTFDWSNGARSEDLAGLAGGEYTVRVTDGLGCAQDLAVTIASDNPTALALGKPTPNPTSGPLRLRFAVPAQTAIRLSVLDLQGREIAVLAEGTQPAGWSWASWNGQTGSGRAPGGVYFFRLQSGGRQIVQRFALIR